MEDAARVRGLDFRFPKIKFPKMDKFTVCKLSINGTTLEMKTCLKQKFHQNDNFLNQEFFHK